MLRTTQVGNWRPVRQTPITIPFARRAERGGHALTKGDYLSRFPSRTWPSREPKQRINGKIRAREVRVLDDEKKPLGVMPLSDALRLAREKGMDLIEIAASADPPVCRIGDYGKFRYEEAKRERHSRPAGTKMKEVQLSAAIDPHDFAVKLAHVIDFLCDDIRVRVKLRFKGRQRAHKEVGFDIVNRFVRAASPYGQADSQPKLLGDRDLNVLLTPLPPQKRAKRSSEGGPASEQKSSPAQPPSEVTTEGSTENHASLPGSDPKPG